MNKKFSEITFICNSGDPIDYIYGFSCVLSHERTLSRIPTGHVVELREALLELLARAYDALGAPDSAKQMRLRRYIETPVSTHTPTSAPAGVTLTDTQRLQRAENLLDAHRNERVLEEL